MNDTAPPLVWPSLLELPPANELVVYLDLNHWIGLSQALAGHPKGTAHCDVLEACRRARSAGKAMFVLSKTIYAEVQKIKDPMQRRRLAEVIEELTDFSTLVSRVVVMDLEFSALLDPVAKLPNPLSKVPLVGPTSQVCSLRLAGRSPHRCPQGLAKWSAPCSTSHLP